LGRGVPAVRAAPQQLGAAALGGEAGAGALRTCMYSDVSTWKRSHAAMCASMLALQRGAGSPGCSSPLSRLSAILISKNLDQFIFQDQLH
jgi:hypothetical protein